MTLTESILEDATLEWFRELGYAIGNGPHIAPGEPAARPGVERHWNHILIIKPKSSDHENIHHS